MDITELTGIAETSSCIITDIHFQRGKFSCRFGGVFLALFVCLFVVYRKAAVRPTRFSSLLYTVVSATCFTQHYGHLQDGFISISKPK